MVENLIAIAVGILVLWGIERVGHYHEQLYIK